MLFGSSFSHVAWRAGLAVLLSATAGCGHRSNLPPMALGHTSTTSLERGTTGIASSVAHSGPFTLYNAVSLTGFVEYPVPTANSNLGDITLGSDGNAWFTELGSANFSGKLGRITPAGRITEFGHRVDVPRRITSGPDHNLWFITGNCQIIGYCRGLGFGRITTSGVITLFPTAACAWPQSITAGPDGNLWMLLIQRAEPQPGFCTPGGSEKVLKISKSGKIVASFQNSKIDFDIGSQIVSGPDGNLWIAQYNSIARMTTSGAVSLFYVPNGSAIDITVGPPANQRLWLQENFAIGEMTTGGTVKQFADPDGPVDIAAGADGNMWFTEAFSNSIGRIIPSGSITRFSLPPNRGASGITAGLGRTMWFTENTANKIARFIP